MSDDGESIWSDFVNIIVEELSKCSRFEKSSGEDNPSERKRKNVDIYEGSFLEVGTSKCINLSSFQGMFQGKTAIPPEIIGVITSYLDPPMVAMLAEIYPNVKLALRRYANFTGTREVPPPVPQDIVSYAHDIQSESLIVWVFVEWLRVPPHYLVSNVGFFRGRKFKVWAKENKLDLQEDDEVFADWVLRSDRMTLDFFVQPEQQFWYNLGRPVTEMVKKELVKKNETITAGRVRFMTRIAKIEMKARAVWAYELSFAKRRKPSIQDLLIMMSAPIQVYYDFARIFPKPSVTSSTEDMTIFIMATNVLRKKATSLTNSRPEMRYIFDETFVPHDPGAIFFETLLVFNNFLAIRPTPATLVEAVLKFAQNFPESSDRQGVLVEDENAGRKTLQNENLPRHLIGTGVRLPEENIPKFLEVAAKTDYLKMLFAQSSDAVCTKGFEMIFDLIDLNLGLFDGVVAAVYLTMFKPLSQSWLWWPSDMTETSSYMIQVVENLHSLGLVGHRDLTKMLITTCLPLPLDVGYAKKKLMKFRARLLAMGADFRSDNYIALYNLLGTLKWQEDFYEEKLDGFDISEPLFNYLFWKSNSTSQKYLDWRTLKKLREAMRDEGYRNTVRIDFVLSELYKDIWPDR